MTPARLFWAAIALLVLIKTALIGWWPFLALMNMPHDASLFVNQAVKILEGNWLGSYSEYTLMKGPITPLWIAFTNFVGAPYLFSLHVLYVGACFLCLLALRRFTDHRGFLLFAFAVVLFNPYTFAYGPVASGFREGLHQPLQLALIAQSIILFMDYVDYRRVRPLFAILFGIVFFMFWNNREEGIWILPYFSVLVVAMSFALWKHRQEKNVGAGMIKLAQLIAIPVIIWLAGSHGLAWKNYQEYGVYAVVELKTPEFERAYGNMIAIEPENWDPVRTLQPDVLDKVYSMPSAGELDINGRATGARHSLHNTNAIWLFRRAVNKSGYYDRGGQSVLAFYDRLGADIEGACKEAKFDCGHSILNAFPPWRPEYTALFFDTVWGVLLGGLINRYDSNIGDFYSIATPRKMLNISLLVNSPVRVEEASAPYLPSFYTRTIKVKTKYQRKLIQIYRVLIPALFIAMVLSVLSGIVRFAVMRRLTALDVIVTGLGASLGTLLILFSLLHITGVTQSSRLYFLFYPILFPLSLIGLLALVRDFSMLRLHSWNQKAVNDA